MLPDSFFKQVSLRFMRHRITIWMGEKSTGCYCELLVIHIYLFESQKERYMDIVTHKELKKEEGFLAFPRETKWPLLHLQLGKEKHALPVALRSHVKWLCFYWNALSVPREIDCAVKNIIHLVWVYTWLNWRDRGAGTLALSWGKRKACVCVWCICAFKHMRMHVCICTCTYTVCVWCVYLACRLLEQSEGSLSQLPLKTGVKLEGWGSLAGLEEVRKTFIADFHMLIWPRYTDCIWKGPLSEISRGLSLEYLKRTKDISTVKLNVELN